MGRWRKLAQRRCHVRVPRKQKVTTCGSASHESVAHVKARHTIECEQHRPRTLHGSQLTRIVGVVLARAFHARAIPTGYSTLARVPVDQTRRLRCNDLLQCRVQTRDAIRRNLGLVDLKELQLRVGCQRLSNHSSTNLHALAEAAPAVVEIVECHVRPAQRHQTVI